MSKSVKHLVMLALFTTMALTIFVVEAQIPVPVPIPGVKLGLANVRCIHVRAEDGAKLPELREQFDMATARAVAAMPVLTEYCLPFVKQGGVFAAMKGPSETAEQAETAAKLLGGEIVGEESYTLPTAGERKLIRIRKTAPTPQKYPRRSDKIKKQPLE